MSKRNELPMSRKHVQVNDEDWAFLMELYGPSSDNRIGPGVAVRKIVHQWVIEKKARIQQRVDSQGAKA